MIRRGAVPLVLVVALTGCPSKSEAVAKNDARIEAAVKAEKLEGKAWLADPTHELVRYGNGNAKKLVEDLYAAGAVEVDVAATQTVGETLVASKVLTKLPAKPDARKKVLAVHNEVATALGKRDQRARDRGETWLELVLD